MTYYLYESHLGGVYWTDEEESFEERYCETCGDYNQSMGTFETEEELREMIEGDYDSEYVDDVIDGFKEETKQ